MRYIPVHVLTSLDLDCSNDGITYVTPYSLVVPAENGHISEEDVAEHGLTVLELQPPRVPGYPPSFKQRGEERWVMFGGNFVYSNDARFGKTYGHSPIKVHDRVE